MRKPNALLVGAVAFGMMASGCYGPFTLVRKVWKWNGEVSDNKWVVELVYLVCSWLPVYGIAGLADAVIFNSVIFWTGKSMLVDNTDTTPKTKRIVRKDSETVLSQAGNEYRIEQYQHGKQTASLIMHREGNGMVAYDAQGTKLFSANTQANGGIVVANAKGEQVASYSAEQAHRMMESARQ